jgi:hypothetical protein
MMESARLTFEHEHVSFEHSDTSSGCGWTFYRYSVSVLAFIAIHYAPYTTRILISH